MPWRGGQKLPPHRLYKHCQLNLMSTRERRHGSPRRVVAIVGHSCMATNRSTEGMPEYPKVDPPLRVVRRKELQDLFWAVKGAFHDLVSSSCTSRRMALEGALRTSVTSTGKPRISHKPDILVCPGKHSRHLWVWLGQRYHTRRGQRSRVIIPGEKDLALRCSDRHLFVRGST